MEKTNRDFGRLVFIKPGLLGKSKGPKENHQGKRLGAGIRKVGSSETTTDDGGDPLYGGQGFEREMASVYRKDETWSGV